MRPGTIFNWIDQSGIQKNIVQTPTMPLMLTAFSSDKGPEDLRRVYGEDFYKLYGYDISFERHGQPLLQAANIIDNGGELLVKRVVASDATLANAAVIAKVTAKSVQKKNSDGELLYKDAVTGENTTTADGNEPIMINTAEISFEISTVENIKTVEEAKVAVESLTDTEGTEGVFTYPLLVVCDNGRGVSHKRFNIVPDYNVSKNLGFMLYYMNSIGDYDKDSETTRFSLDTERVYSNESMGFTEKARNLTQITGASIDASIQSFIDKVSEITGISRSEIVILDILFGATRKGESLNYIAFGENSAILNQDGGFELKSGSNGTFGNAPFGTSEYEKQLVEFYSGKFDDTIFDVDRYKIDVCVDANYPVPVKNAIVELADFREDFFFFRDLGLGNDTFDTIVYAANELPKSKFVADYIQTYEVIDPFTRKHVQVAITYSLARTLIGHLNNYRNAAVCGILYEFVFPEVVEGTLNFAPKYTPTEDQKDALDDLHLNYTSYLNDVLTLETEYTSQEQYTQLSYINNILAIQEVIHDVRNKCPKFRYQFITNDDLEEYRKNVESIIKQYSDRFKSLEFEYTQDDVMAKNKIFNASIKVTFKNFVQTEIFDIYALA